MLNGSFKYSQRSIRLITIHQASGCFYSDESVVEFKLIIVGYECWNWALLSAESTDLHMINLRPAHEVVIKHSGSQSFISLDCDKY